jgi:predicted ATPase
MPRRSKPSAIASPFLISAELREGRADAGQHPFDVPALAHGLPLRFTTPVTYLVGENGSGKSTLLEGIGWALGFSAEGGNRTNSFADGADGHSLGRALALAWKKKVSDGFFLRAETFFNFARYLEEAGSSFSRYGDVPLSQRSHGEGFLALFQNRFEDGIYLLDEPEAALSPARQLAFLALLHQMGSSGSAQFIIATHSPILLSLPGARVLAFDERGITEVGYRDTEHFQLTRDFLNAPERYLRQLLVDGDDD